MPWNPMICSSPLFRTDEEMLFEAESNLDAVCGHIDKLERELASAKYRKQTLEARVEDLQFRVDNEQEEPR